MAELLIKARDASHDDPETDRRGCYKRGDVVVVMPDGHEWGVKEGLPNFVVLKIPGVDPERIRPLVEPQDDDDAGNAVSDTFRRRRWKLAIASIPAEIRNQLQNTGTATVTPAQVRSYLRRKRDNQQFTNL